MHPMSIFQQMSELNKTWKTYVTDTSEEDASWFNRTYKSGNTKLVQPPANYYTDAAAGELPELIVIASTGSCLRW